MKLFTSLLIGGLMMASSVFANPYHNALQTYSITITNITQGQFFTPILAATHRPGLRFFKLGDEPSQALANLAEGGATGDLQDWLEGQPGRVLDIATSGPGLIGPGENKTIILVADRHFNRLSLAGMLLPTNDAFVAIDSMRLPKKAKSRTALAYDAGSEINDELCANIPGPQCGGSPFSDGLAEGYVHISRGISGEGDLNASDYDWRNPVARITVRRID